MILIVELPTTKDVVDIEGFKLCPILTWCQSRQRRDMRDIGSVLVNQIESADGKWFYRVFVKAYIAGIVGWNLG